MRKKALWYFETWNFDLLCLKILHAAVQRRPFWRKRLKSHLEERFWMAMVIPLKCSDVSGLQLQILWLWKFCISILESIFFVTRRTKGRRKVKETTQTRFYLQNRTVVGCVGNRYAGELRLLSLITFLTTEKSCCLANLKIKNLRKISLKNASDRFNFLGLGVVLRRTLSARRRRVSDKRGI